MSTEVKKTNTVDSNDGALSKWGILALAVGANIGAGLIDDAPQWQLRRPVTRYGSRSSSPSSLAPLLQSLV